MLVLSKATEHPLQDVIIPTAYDRGDFHDGAGAAGGRCPPDVPVLFAVGTDDAARRRVRTGKTVRLTKSRLSEAWERPDAPGYLLPPLQGILYNEAHARVVRAQRAHLCLIPAGQVVGTLTGETSVREVMYQMQTEYLTAMERISGSLA